MINKRGVTCDFFLEENLREIVLISVFLFLLFLFHYILSTVHRHVSSWCVPEI